MGIVRIVCCSRRTEALQGAIYHLSLHIRYELKDERLYRKSYLENRFTSH